MMLPPALVYDAAGGVVPDPDRQVQQATRLIFEWKVLIPEAHPGYITWERYQANLAVLEANGLRLRKNAHPTPAREASALLQRMVVCGQCGWRMTIQYHPRGHPSYVCRQSSKERGGNACQIISGAAIDPAIGQLVVETMTPAAIQVALEVFEELRQRHDQVDALHQSRIQRA